MRLWGHLRQDWVVLHVSQIGGGLDCVALCVIWRGGGRADWMALHQIWGQGGCIVGEMLGHAIQGDGRRIDWIC